MVNVVRSMMLPTIAVGLFAGLVYEASTVIEPHLQLLFSLLG